MSKTISTISPQELISLIQPKEQLPLPVIDIALEWAVHFARSTDQVQINIEFIILVLRKSLTSLSDLTQEHALALEITNTQNKKTLLTESG